MCEGVFNIISEAHLMLTHVRDTRTSYNSLTEKVIKLYLDCAQYVKTKPQKMETCGPLKINTSKIIGSKAHAHLSDIL
jgi:hypothetical protein